MTVAAAVPTDDEWPAPGNRPAQPFDLWTRANVDEAWPEPVTPLTWSTIPALHGGSFRTMLRAFRLPYAADLQLFARFYGRVYFNEGALLRVMGDELGLPAAALDAGTGGLRGGLAPRYRRLRPLRLVRHLPGFVRLTRRQRQATRTLQALFATIDQWAGEAGQFEVRMAPLDDRAIWVELERRLERFGRVLDEYNLVLSAAAMQFGRLAQAVARWTGRGDLAQDLVAGLSGVFTAQMGTALWRIAHAIHVAGLGEAVLADQPAAVLARFQQQPEARPVLDHMQAFLNQFGHRCPNEPEWLHPRWVEAPERVLEIVAGYVRAGVLSDSADMAETASRRRRETATAWVESRLDAVRRVGFRRLLSGAQNAVRLRDNGRHYTMKAALLVRRLYAALGERWTERGWLAHQEDVFFLAHAELGAIAAGAPGASGRDLRTKVAARRAAYERWFDVAPPAVIGPAGRPVETGAGASPRWMGRDSGAAGARARALEGIAASGGSARGVARIIKHPSEAGRLRTGDILITHATDPGWTPLFPLVGGLVLETGGQLSHGAIVAREYGVPAVLSVPQATQRIRDGQMVSIDGSAGRVVLEDTA